MPNTQQALRVEQPCAVVFFGISGAGKGTQADLLARHLNAVDPTRGVLRVEQGALLRARASCDDEIGKRVATIIASGKLVPNFVATSLLADYVSEHFSSASHFVFDGVARYDLQARMFDELMVFFDRATYKVIVLELSAEDAKKRLALRGRSDEATDEQMQNRFRWYTENTLPAIEILEKEGRKVHRIDASLSIDQIHKTVLDILTLGAPTQENNALPEGVVAIEKHLGIQK
jgi:adenylate kinase